MPGKNSGSRSGGWGKILGQRALYTPVALDEDAGLHDKDGRDGNNEEHIPDSNVSHFAINQIFSENYDQLYNQKQMTTHNVSHVNSEPDTLVDNNPKPHRDGRDDEKTTPSMRQIVQIPQQISATLN